MQRQTTRNIQIFKKKGFQASKFMGKKKSGPQGKFGRKSPGK
jgi:hypothetical protein